MRALIVASSASAARTFDEIRKGALPRLDYYELSEALDAPFVDETPPWTEYPAFIRTLERKLRLDFYWAGKVARKVDEEGYNLVISLSERMGIPLAHLLNDNVRHVTLSHKPLSPNKLRLIRLLRSYRHWDVLLTFSQAEADALQAELGSKSKRIQPLYWGIDTEYFRPSAVSASGAEPDHIFSIGVSNRDYPTLLEAMRQLPHVRCHISATSAWESASDVFHNLPENVEIKSYNHPRVIREAYANCRFVVIPLQRTHQWSAGCTSVLQPQAMGKPVIATGLPGLSEYMVEGETGLLVPPHDPQAMARAIDELWRDPARAEAMGRKGKGWVRANRSLAGSIEQLAKLARDVSACRA